MSVIWDKFVMNGHIVTDGGVMISIVADSGAPDFFVLSMDQPQAKLTQSNLNDLMQLVSREGFARLTVK